MRQMNSVGIKFEVSLLQEKQYKIFDAHIHTYGTFIKPYKSIIEYMDNFGVEKAIITTINRAANSKVFTETRNDLDQKKQTKGGIALAFEKLRNSMPKGQLDHQDVLNETKKSPERFYKFFWFNPKLDPDEEEQNFKILEEHFKTGFCGVKIHSGIHLVKIPKDIEKLISFMQEYDKNFPIFIHTTPKTSFFSGTSAKDISRLAEKYPELKIIMGHAALAMELALELGLNLRKYKNVYFETSCSIPYGILNLIRNVGHQRILFGSDAPVTNPIQLEIDKIKYLPIPSDQKQDIFYNNIESLLES